MPGQPPHGWSRGGTRQRVKIHYRIKSPYRRLLVALAATGPLSVGELAAKMGLATPTVSLLVGEANRAGFLDRCEDDCDRRRTIVSLPERIQAPLERLARATAQPLRRTLEQLDPTA